MLGYEGFVKILSGRYRKAWYLPREFAEVG
jgi:hypothetical protein